MAFCVLAHLLGELARAKRATEGLGTMCVGSCRGKPSFEVTVHRKVAFKKGLDMWRLRHNFSINFKYLREAEKIAKIKKIRLHGGDAGV